MPTLTEISFVKIKRERASQRRHHRLTAPLNVKVNGEKAVTVDWSLGGIRVAEYDAATLRLGETVMVELQLPFQGFGISFEAKAEVVRLIPADRQVACAFVALDQRQTDLLNHFIGEIIAGNVTMVEDTLQRIDTPVTPASLEPDPNPVSDLPLRRRSLRQIGMSCFYLSIGVTLIGYFSLIVYSNFFSMKLESGVVSAPLEQIVSPTDGKISQLGTPLNLWVRRNTNLLDVEDPGLEKEIALAGIGIERSDLALRQSRQALALAEQKAREYEVFAESRIAESKIELVAKNGELAVARRHLTRVESLVESKLASHRELDQARLLLTESERGARQASQRLESAERTLETLRTTGRFFTGERLEGDVGEIRSELERLVSESELAKKELAALLDSRRRMNIAAPTDGRLVELIKGPGSAIKKGEVLGYFEREEARVVDVFMTQSEVLHISLGQEARVYVPALDRSVRAQVTSVDRSTAYMNEKSSSYVWRATEDRTAKVTLMFSDISESDVRQQFNPGTPAVVLFPGQANSIMGELILTLRSQFMSLTTGDQISIADR
jgi:multidrug resistance efflux pump